MPTAGPADPRASLLVRRPHIGAMPTPKLTDNDRADLVRFLITRYPLSPRVRSFRAILAKLDPPIARPEPLPPPKPPGERSMALTKKRRR
jgi:hypothetical protein